VRPFETERVCDTRGALMRLRGLSSSARTAAGVDPKTEKYAADVAYVDRTWREMAAPIAERHGLPVEGILAQVMQESRATLARSGKSPTLDGHRAMQTTHPSLKVGYTDAELYDPHEPRNRDEAHGRPRAAVPHARRSAGLAEGVRCVQRGLSRPDPRARGTSSAPATTSTPRSRSTIPCFWLDSTMPIRVHCRLSSCNSTLWRCSTSRRTTYEHAVAASLAGRGHAAGAEDCRLSVCNGVGVMASADGLMSGTAWSATDSGGDASHRRRMARSAPTVDVRPKSSGLRPASGSHELGGISSL